VLVESKGDVCERIIISYLCFLTKNYEKLFHLTQNSKNLELLSLRSFGYLAINREDLAKSKSLSEMKKLDDDNILTVITETLV